MMNKKGYIKTLEAVIAIIAILVFTFGVIPTETSDPSDVPFVVENSLNYIIDTIANGKIGDDTYRELVLTNEGEANVSITILIEQNLPPNYDYEFQICDTTTCLAENAPMDVSVYNDDIILAGSYDDLAEVKIVRIWMWPKV